MVSIVPTLLVVSCDDPPLTPPAGTPPPAVQRRPSPPPAKQKKEPARPELTDGDFVESSASRDPFRSFLGEFKTSGPRRTVVQRKVILPRYGLDELKLIAVVTGGAVRARAMFRDPTGLGVTVKRGDRISKSSAKVKRILRHSVVMEVEERSEDTQQAAERVIELHPKEERAKERAEQEVERGSDQAVPVEAE